MLAKWIQVAGGILYLVQSSSNAMASSRGFKKNRYIETLLCIHPNVINQYFHK